MKRSILMMLLVFVTIASFAQDRLITGVITDRDTKDPVEQVTIQLLKTDSTYVSGALSNEQGLFHIKAPANGKYLLKMSSVGYKTTVKRIEISDDKNLAMGNVVLGADAIMLKATFLPWNVCHFTTSINVNFPRRFFYLKLCMRKCRQPNGMIGRLSKKSLTNSLIYIPMD